MIAKFYCQKERLRYVQNITMANYFLLTTALDSSFHNSIEKNMLLNHRISQLCIWRIGREAIRGGPATGLMKWGKKKREWKSS